MARESLSIRETYLLLGEKEESFPPPDLVRSLLKLKAFQDEEQLYVDWFHLLHRQALVPLRPDLAVTQCARRFRDLEWKANRDRTIRIITWVPIVATVTCVAIQFVFWCRYGW